MRAEPSAFAGVDGCKGGWIAVSEGPGRPLEARVFERLEQLVVALPENAVIAVDMPIGLPETIGAGGRGPERLVRDKLAGRRSSVFSIPSRQAVHASSCASASIEAFREAYRLANAAARQTSEPPRGISVQAFGIFPKIQELDSLLRANPEMAGRAAGGKPRGHIFEAHPEFAFWRLNGGQPLQHAKKARNRIRPEGMAERRVLLEKHGMPTPFLAGAPPRGAAIDDFLDACALLFVARRIAAGEAKPFPDPPLTDGHGLPIAIWC